MIILPFFYFYSMLQVQREPVWRDSKTFLPDRPWLSRADEVTELTSKLVSYNTE